MASLLHLSQIIVQAAVSFFFFFSLGLLSAYNVRTVY